MALYVRVSTAEQNAELQLRELREYAERQGWPIVVVYQDIISGAKSSRPELNRLMLDAAAHKFSWYGNWTGLDDRWSIVSTTFVIWKCMAYGSSL